jgi:hypothetical protein
VRGLLATRYWVGPVAWLDVDAASASRPLDQRACHAFGAAVSTTLSRDSGIEGLLDHLAATAKATRGPALLVIDAAVAMAPHAQTLRALSLAARATEYFSLIVIGDAETASFLQDPESIEVPPLTPGQLVEYLRGRIALAREPGTAPLLLTPDAALLIHVRSGGNLGKANRIATRMLAAAVAQRCRVLTSLHAWSAADLTDGLPAASSRGRRWPTTEVFELINTQRAALGLEPRAENMVSGASGDEGPGAPDAQNLRPV